MFCKYGAILNKTWNDRCYCSTCVSTHKAWAAKKNNGLKYGNIAFPCEYCMSQGGTFTKINNQWIADIDVTYSTAHVHQAAPAPPTVAAPMALSNVPHNQAPASPVSPGLSPPANGAASSHDVPEPIDSGDERDTKESLRKEVDSLKMKLDCQRQLLASSVERENHLQSQILFLREQVTRSLKAITTDHGQLLKAISEVQNALNDDRSPRASVDLVPRKRRSRSLSASLVRRPRRPRGSS